MQKSSDLPRKMAEIRLTTERDLQIHRKKVASTVNSLRESLQSIKLKAEETVQHQVKLSKLKDYLRQTEDEMVSVKTRKEAKQHSTVEALSDVKGRVEKLEEVVLGQQERRDRCRKIISEQLLVLATLEEKSSQAKEQNKDFEEPICWYNRVLGMRIEGGQGVKFIFNKIDLKNPNKEFSFKIRHDNGTYTLIDCQPHLDGMEEWIQDLNRTNGLYKFVRNMRENFWLTASDVRSQNMSQSGQAGLDRPTKKVNHGRPDRPLISSPGSALSVRASPRFKRPA